MQEQLGLAPLCGAVLVLRSKRADRIKVLVWDRTGLVLVHKGREGGKFAWPQVRDGMMRVSWATCSARGSGRNPRSRAPRRTTCRSRTWRWRDRPCADRHPLPHRGRGPRCRARDASRRPPAGADPLPRGRPPRARHQPGRDSDPPDHPDMQERAVRRPRGRRRELGAPRLDHRHLQAERRRPSHRAILDGHPRPASSSPCLAPSVHSQAPPDRTATRRLQSFSDRRIETRQTTSFHERASTRALSVRAAAGSKPASQAVLLATSTSTRATTPASSASRGEFFNSLAGGVFRRRCGGETHNPGAPQPQAKWTPRLT